MKENREYNKEAHLDGKEITLEEIKEIKSNQTENVEEKKETVIVPTMMRSDSRGNIEEVEVETAMYEINE